MDSLETVSSELLELLTELQMLESLSSFALAGGTNLSIRYNHRESIDIDLFSKEIVGIGGLKAIEKQLHETFKRNLLFLNIEDPGYGAQYCFIKSLIRKGDLNVKVEILQNIQLLYPIEVGNKIRFISVADIGMMKLKSVSNRKAQKDVYDLDRITEDISLVDLMERLRVRDGKFQEERYKCLFDLDKEASPLDNPLILLEFDKINYQNLDKRPTHSNDILRINKDNKSWVLARTSWKRKVFKYCKDNNIEIPKGGPIN